MIGLLAFTSTPEVVPAPVAILFGAENHRGLLQAIQIQLSDAAVVMSAEALPEGSLNKRIAAAAEVVARQEAGLGLWVESSSVTEGGIELVLFVAVAHEGRTIVQTIALTGRFAPDLERAAALKVREIVDEPQRHPKPALPALPTEARPASRFALVLEAGGLGLFSRDAAQGGGLARVGARYRSQAWGLELRGGGRLISRIVRTESFGHAEVDEWDLGIGLSGLLFVSPRVTLGTGVEFAVRFLRGRGITPSGTEGAASLQIPALTTSVEARIPLFSMVEVRGAVGFGLPFEHRQFSVNDMPVVDVGKWQVITQLSAVLIIPPG